MLVVLRTLLVYISCSRTQHGEVTTTARNIELGQLCLRQVIRETEREFILPYQTYEQISNNNETKGGLPEEAKAHRAGHALLRHQQVNKNKFG